MLEELERKRTPATLIPTTSIHRLRPVRPTRAVIINFTEAYEWEQEDEEAADEELAAYVEHLEQRLDAYYAHYGVRIESSHNTP